MNFTDNSGAFIWRYIVRIRTHLPISGQI